MISSAYRLCSDLIEEQYDAENWNIYAFHFSDGDNWSVDDTSTCLKIMRETLFPQVNQFGYGQVESPYGSGQFVKDLRSAFGDADFPPSCYFQKDKKWNQFQKHNKY